MGTWTSRLRGNTLLMSQSPLLGPEDTAWLAGLVNGVTANLCGASFWPDPSSARGDSVCTLMTMVPLLGIRQTNLVLATDHRAGRALAGALLGIRADAATSAQLRASHELLLQMVGTRVASERALGQTLGVARKVSLADLVGEGMAFADAVPLRSEGALDLRLWIYDLGDADSGPVAVKGSRLTRFVRRTFRL